MDNKLNRKTQKRYKFKIMSKIVCQWLEDKKVVVNPDGQVYPCCYLSNPGYTAKIQEEVDGYITHGYDVVHDESPTRETNIMKKYYQHEQQLNLFNNTLSDILTHEWFQEILPNSWKEESTTHRICQAMCTRI